VAKYIQDAYASLFKKAQRVAVTKAGLYTASTPYQGGSGTRRPTPSAQKHVINGVTEDGIHVIHKSDERFSDLKTADGEYLQTWFEFLPDEVLNGTAPAGTVPLILAMHGGGDDPRQFVDEIGLLSLAGSERFAMVAPEHQYIGFSMKGGMDLKPDEPASRRHPQRCSAPLRPVHSQAVSGPRSLRVYVTGYSMGGGATLRAINGDPLSSPLRFPWQRHLHRTPEQAAQFKRAHLPIMLTTSSFDLPGAFDPPTETIAVGYQTQIKLFLGYNDMKPIEAFDFKTWPISGFKADRVVRIKLNGEYANTRWYINNADGVPMVALSYTEN